MAIIDFANSESANLGDDVKERNTIQDWNESYDFAIRSWGCWIGEANKDLSFYLGDQWTANERNNLQQQKRSVLVFNKIHRIIKMIEGFERKTRMSLIANATERSDEKAANQMSSILLWLMNRANMHMIMSDAFAASLKVGMNLLVPYIDFNEDPIHGDIKLSRTHHGAVLLDPRIEKRDLSDCEFILQRKIITKDAAKALLPFRAEEIEMLPSGGIDQKFTNMPVVKDFKGKNSVRYDEFWIRKTRPVKILIDRANGERKKWRGTNERLEQFLNLFPNIKVIDKIERTVEMNVIIEDKLMFSKIDPFGIGDFPHVPVMCFFDPEFDASSSEVDAFSLKLQGVVRGIRDAQIEINKRRSKMLDIIDSQLNSGWIAKSGSVTNPKDLYATGQGKVVWTSQNSQSGDVIKIPPGDLPPGILQMSEIFDKDIVEISGANTELFGMPENENLQISGILAKVRQGAGLTILQDIFDNFRFTQKLLGEKLIKLVQRFFSPQKVARVLGEQPAPNLFDSELSKFDLSVEEAIETPSQRNLFYMQMMQARQSGINIPDSVILESMPTVGKDKIIQVIKQQEQAMQRQQQLELEERNVINRLSQSKIINDIASAREKTTASVENRSQALLNRAKTIAEIEQMDEERLLKLIELMRQLDVNNFQQTPQSVNGV